MSRIAEAGFETRVVVQTQQRQIGCAIARRDGSGDADGEDVSVRKWLCRDQAVDVGITR
jgi:hypothetical protein